MGQPALLSVSTREQYQSAAEGQICRPLAHLYNRGAFIFQLLKIINRFVPFHDS